MREALALVKQEQGPDAVILGNKKVPGGVEILSAIDFDHREVDAYSGDPAMPLTAATTQGPSFEKPVVQANDPIQAQLDAVANLMLNGGDDERKEPVLGFPATAKENQTEVTSVPVKTKPKASSVKQRPDNRQTSTARPRKALPVEQEVNRRHEKTDKLLGELRENQYRQTSQGVDAQPVIDEVKGELKNLRDLMQSQLNVLEWDRYNQRHPVRSVLLNLMTELGLGTDICEVLLNQLGQFSSDPHKVWQQTLALLARAIPIGKTDILSHGGRIALVGSTGVGKTTTIAKLAARFAHTHGKQSVALVTTDNFRIGAHEQLQHFARMLEVPLLTANDSHELTDRLKMFSDKRLVLIDTAGMSQNDVRLSEQFHKLQHGSPEIRPYLVLSANTQLAALNETIKNFSKVKLAGAIVTKLDESASLGGIITAAIRHRLPLTYCGTGQRVPEDLQLAKNHRLVSRAVALMQRYTEQVDKETLAFRYNNLIHQQQRQQR
jgi:flagellar biosynthesis protein FlhF